MIRIIMRGCNGKMGQSISNLLSTDPEAEMVAGVDIFDAGRNTYPVFPDFDSLNVEADCLIDFAAAKDIDKMLDYCVKKKLPCVLCTTGLSEEQLNQVNEASKKVAILRSANMSLGINLLLKMLKEATAILAPAGFDIEIVEKHHNLKVDAPSGTALALADSINEELNSEYEYVFDRSQRREKRPVKEIGISAVRGGTIVGEHDIIFAGRDEIITLSHSARSKEVFAVGAVNAAVYMAGKGAGLYDMKELID